MGCSSTAGGPQDVHVEGGRGLLCKRFVRQLTSAVCVCVCVWARVGLVQAKPTDVIILSFYLSIYFCI